MEVFHVCAILPQAQVLLGIVSSEKGVGEAGAPFSGYAGNGNCNSVDRAESGARNDPSSTIRNFLKGVENLGDGDRSYLTH